MEAKVFSSTEHTKAVEVPQLPEDKCVITLTQRGAKIHEARSMQHAAAMILDQDFDKRTVAVICDGSIAPDIAAFLAGLQKSWTRKPVDDETAFSKMDALLSSLLEDQKRRTIEREVTGIVLLYCAQLLLAFPIPDDERKEVADKLRKISKMTFLAGLINSDTAESIRLSADKIANG